MVTDRWFALRAKSEALLDAPVVPAPSRDPFAPDALEKWTAGMPEAEPEPEPPPRRGLDTAPAPAPIDWGSVIDDRVEAEHEFTVEVLAHLVADIKREFAGKVRKLREERSDAKAELVEETRRLRIELAELQTVVGELRQALAHERGKPLDLPSPLSRRVN
jgi:hypothetical protein